MALRYASRRSGRENGVRNVHHREERAPLGAVLIPLGRLEQARPAAADLVENVRLGRERDRLHVHDPLQEAANMNTEGSG